MGQTFLRHLMVADVPDHPSRDRGIAAVGARASPAEKQSVSVTQKESKANALYHRQCPQSTARHTHSSQRGSGGVSVQCFALHPSRASQSSPHSHPSSF